MARVDIQVPEHDLPTASEISRGTQTRFVIFDFDGTLADSFPLFLDVFDETAAQFGFHRFDRENLDSLRALSARDILRHHRVPFWMTPLVVAKARRLMARDINRVRTFDGIDLMLTTLHEAGLTLGLLTSNSKENVARVLGDRAISQFSYIKCRVSIFSKRASLKRLRIRAGFRAAETLLIGDEVRDVQAANFDKVPFGAVSWGYSDIDTLVRGGAQLTFSSPDDLSRKILQLQ